MDDLKRLHKKKMAQLFNEELDENQTAFLMRSIRNIERDLRNRLTQFEYQLWHIFNGIDIALHVEEEPEMKTAPTLRLVVNNS